MEEEKLISLLFVSETQEQILREFEGESDEEIKAENAKELVSMYYTAMNPNVPDYNISYRQAKQCALISVDREIESIHWLNLLCRSDNNMKEFLNSKIEELKEIKQEIEKLF